MKPILAAVALLFCVAACGGGSSNPLGSIGSLNPFGGQDEPEDTSVDPAATRADLALNDGSVLVPVILEATPEPALRGVILRVRGVTATQGYYDAQLRPLSAEVPEEGGVLRFEFRATPPAIPRGVGPQNTREVVAATFVSDALLNNISGFEVIGSSNVLNFRR